MQERKTRSSSFGEAWMFKYGLFGVLLGATAPAAFLLLEKALFHPRLSFPDFLMSSIISSPRDLLIHGFLFGAIFVLGIYGAAVGRLRKEDAARRLELEERSMELYALNAISKKIARSRDLDGLLHGVLMETLSLSFLNIEKKGVIFITDANGETCRMAASCNLPPGLTGAEERIPLGHCLCGRAAQTGEVIISDDCFKDERHDVKYDGMENHGHVVMPIKGKDKVHGVMCFYISPGAVPARRDVRILESIACQLSVAIENVKLLREVMEANEHAQRKNLENEMNLEALNSLIEVDRVIMSTRERDEMLLKVSAQVRQVMRADVGIIALRDHFSDFFSCITAWGLEIKKGDMAMEADAFGRYAEWQVEVGELDKKCLEEDCSAAEKMMLMAGIKRSLIIPIIKQNRAQGVLVLGSYDKKGLTKKDAGTALNFASRMGMALEHVRLICDLEELSVNIIQALASAIDAKSPWTKGHSERVAEYAVAIGEKIGLSVPRLERLRLAGLLHDIGKIGTFDKLLEKTDRLTPDEWELIKQHPGRGCEILEPIKELGDILPAVRHHHERWDGKGYPDGLKGEKIPLFARILCVADSLDTMTDDRPYRPSIGFDNAVQELLYCSGSQFDPEIVSALLDTLGLKGISQINQRGKKPFYSSPSTAI